MRREKGKNNQIIIVVYHAICMLEMIKAKLNERMYIYTTTLYTLYFIIKIEEISSTFNK